MACASCPSGVTVGTASTSVYQIPSNSGNDVSGIPVKVGEPLSSSCDRAVTVGSIPEVIRHPAFTTVDGAVLASKSSNGAIPSGALVSFFSGRSKAKGCFGDISLYGSTCA